VELTRQVEELRKNNESIRCSPGWNYFYSTDGSFHTVINPAKLKKFVVGDYISVGLKRGYILRIGYRAEGGSRKFISVWYAEMNEGKLMDKWTIARLSEISTALPPPNCPLTPQKLEDLQKKIAESLKAPITKTDQHEVKPSVKNEDDHAVEIGEFDKEEEEDVEMDEDVPARNTRSKSTSPKSAQVDYRETKVVASSTRTRAPKKRGKSNSAPKQEPELAKNKKNKNEQQPQQLQQPQPVQQQQQFAASPQPQQFAASPQPQQFAASPQPQQFATSLQPQQFAVSPQNAFPATPFATQNPFPAQFIQPQYSAPPIFPPQYPTQQQYPAQAYPIQQYVVPTPQLFREKFCPECGTNEMNGKFCCECGHKRL
jgi:hypothetical protein